MKKIIQMAFITGIMLFSAGCGVATVKQQVNCEKNVDCANKLVTQCDPGTFILGTTGAETKFTVKEKRSDGCLVEWGFLNNQSPPYGNSTMTCLASLTFKTADEMSSQLFSNKFQGCNGELKDKITKPIKEVVPESNNDQAGCADAECANKILASCEKNSFTVKTANGADLKFSIQAKVAVGCVADAQFTSNPNQNLVGPKMRCMLPATIKTVADIDNLIKNKFVASDESSSSNVCSGDLYRLLQ